MKSCIELPALTKLSFLGSVLHLSHSRTGRSLFLVLSFFWSCILIHLKKTPSLSCTLGIMVVLLSNDIFWASFLYYCMEKKSTELHKCNYCFVQWDGEMLARGMSFADDDCVLFLSWSRWADLTGFHWKWKCFKRWLYLWETSKNMRFFCLILLWIRLLEENLEFWNLEF